MAGKRLAGVALIALLVAGCSSAPPVPADHYYRISLEQAPARLVAPLLDGVLQVQRFDAGALLGNRPLVYESGAKPHELQTYNYHYWVDAPAAMLQGQMVDYLRDAGVARQVVTPELRIHPDYRLSGRIKRLEQVTGSRPRAVVALELVVTDADGKVRLLKDYQRSVAASGPGVAAAVEAINSATAAIYAQFLHDLEATLRRKD